jgi:hypothetical protein
MIIENGENPRARRLPHLPWVWIFAMASVCASVGIVQSFIDSNTNQINSALPLDCESGQSGGKGLIVDAKYGNPNVNLYPVDWFGSVYIEKGTNVEGDYLKSNLPFGQMLNSTDVHPDYGLIEVKSILNGKGVVFKEHVGKDAKSKISEVYTATMKVFPGTRENKYNIELEGTCVK